MQKKLLRNSICLLCLLLIAGAGCKRDKETYDEAEISQIADEVAEEGDEHLSEDFLDFYDKFHDDFEYQIAHITWPLKGMPSNTNSEGEVTEIPKDFTWKKDEWRQQQRIRNDNKAFTQSFAKIDDKMVIERIDAKGTNLRIERRFAKLAGGEWYLIYYMAMNPISMEVDKVLEK